MSYSASPKVSIIVPVYKVEAYLAKCLDSILAQAFGDFELLLIDDGSPDGSGAICDDYASKDARIRVFHQANGGVSVARNTGLDNACGEWLAFVDSDDWVEPNWLDVFGEEKLSLTVAADMLFYGRRNFRGAKTVYQFMPSRECWDSESILNSDEFYYVALWSCFFRREIIERYAIRLTPGMAVAEDTEFLLKCIAVCPSISGLRATPYNYLEREGSATRTVTRDFARASKDLVAINSFLRFCAKFNLDSARYSACVARSYRIFLRVYLAGPNPKREDKRKFISFYDETCTLHSPFKDNKAWRVISKLWFPSLLIIRALMAGNSLLKSRTAK